MLQFLNTVMMVSLNNFNEKIAFLMLSRGEKNEHELIVVSNSLKCKCITWPIYYCRSVSAKQCFDLLSPF